MLWIMPNKYLHIDNPFIKSWFQNVYYNFISLLVQFTEQRPVTFTVNLCTPWITLSTIQVLNITYQIRSKLVSTGLIGTLNQIDKFKDDISYWSAIFGVLMNRPLTFRVVNSPIFYKLFQLRRSICLPLPCQASTSIIGDHRENSSISRLQDLFN